MQVPSSQRLEPELTPGGPWLLICFCAHFLLAPLARLLSAFSFFCCRCLGPLVPFLRVLAYFLFFLLVAGLVSPR